jgi:hypothetical protein
MFGKILPVMAAGILVGTVASAFALDRGAPEPLPYDPYYGTYWDNVAPYNSVGIPDPYAGRYYNNVAPYAETAIPRGTYNYVVPGGPRYRYPARRVYQQPE